LAGFVALHGGIVPNFSAAVHEGKSRGGDMGNYVSVVDHSECSDDCVQVFGEFCVSHSWLTKSIHSGYFAEYILDIWGGQHSYGTSQTMTGNVDGGISEQSPQCLDLAIN
jgi:hypothetical protein